MQILITGGTGFIGSSLVQSLLQLEHTIYVFTRQGISDTDHCHYISRLDSIPDDAHFDAVINLAGESLADKRWTKHYKQTLVDSRLKTTAALIALLQRLQHRPSVLLSASAIGYYGHQGCHPLSEDADIVTGFAQHLCQQWESQAGAAESLGIRVCYMRFGVVLDSDGGAMRQMLRPYNFGIANWLGSGQQWLSWVHRYDAIQAIQFLLAEQALSGPFNITAPEPVTSRGFCSAMKKHKRTLLTLPLPAFMMRLLIGEMANELLLHGQRVVPTALLNAGFSFRYPTLDSALQAILKPGGKRQPITSKLV